MKNLSRTNILMLAIVSIFTGMIAPAVWNESISLPYAMTNVQYVAYGILGISTILFFTAAFRFRAITSIFNVSLIVLLLSLAMFSIAGIVKNFSGIILQSFAWGWIFLLIGGVLLLWMFISREQVDQKTEFWEFYEKIIGVVGFIVLLILSVFVIFVAEKTAKKIDHKADLYTIFAKDDVQVLSGATLSRPFDEIKNFYFNRKNDVFSFVWVENGESVLYPSKQKLENSLNVSSVQIFWKRTFLIYENGVVMENDKVLGILQWEINEKFLLLKNADNKYVFINDEWENIIDANFEEIDKLTYVENTKNIYWRARDGELEAIYKNGKKISNDYKNILRFALSHDETLMLVVERDAWEKMIIRDKVVIHTMNENYVSGTLQMNGNDTLYAIKNPDDGSFSLVMNGTILERKLDEVREIFLEKNSSGFAYFGRPQAEPQYCLFTRYKGNLCGLSGYMNPKFTPYSSDVIFAGLKDNTWKIYRNTNEFVKDINYTETKNIYGDFFFFDTTTPRYFLIVEKKWDKYILNKMWKRLPEAYDDIDIESVKFGYDEKIFIVVKHDGKWKIAEL